MTWRPSDGDPACRECGAALTLVGKCTATANHLTGWAACGVCNGGGLSPLAELCRHCDGLGVRPRNLRKKARA